MTVRYNSGVNFNKLDIFGERSRQLAQIVCGHKSAEEEDLIFMRLTPS